MATMTAERPATSLLELGAGRLAAAFARRRQRRGNRPGLLAYVGELLGTILALACLTVAAFVGAGLVLGLLAAGVAILLLDFKVAVVRRAMATRGRTLGRA